MNPFLHSRIQAPGYLSLNQNRAARYILSWDPSLLKQLDQLFGFFACLHPWHSHDRMDSGGSHYHNTFTFSSSRALSLQRIRWSYLHTCLFPVGRPVNALPIFQIGPTLTVQVDLLIILLFFFCGSSRWLLQCVLDPHLNWLLLLLEKLPTCQGAVNSR